MWNRGASDGRKKVKRKLDVGWKPGRAKRRREIAATMIQKRFRSYLLRSAFQMTRADVKSTFRSLQAFHRVRARGHWRRIDLRTKSYDELRLLALSLNLPSTGKKIFLIGRIQRWLDQHARANDLAGQAAAVARHKHAKAQGDVYYCEARPDAELTEIRPLQGKHFTRISASSNSDAVYAIDADEGSSWLCRSGGSASQAQVVAASKPLMSPKGIAITLPSSTTKAPSMTASKTIRKTAVALGKYSPSLSVPTPPPKTERAPEWLVPPVFLRSLKTEHVRDVQASDSHGLALTDDEIFSWGDNPHGELGFGAETADEVTSNPPTVVLSISRYKSVGIACGSLHGVAICNGVAGDDGVVFCWGNNTFGQLGKFHVAPTTASLGGTAALSLPSSAAKKEPPSSLTGFKDKGTVQELFPKPFYYCQVDGLQCIPITKVACGALHTLALSKDGRVYTWGCNDGSRLGHGTKFAGQNKRMPSRVEGCLRDRIAVDIACGTWHNACIAREKRNSTIDLGGRVYTWGTGIYGQLGTGSTQLLHEPQVVRIPHKIVLDEEFAIQIACGQHHTAVLTSQNRVYTWGSYVGYSPTPTRLELPDYRTFNRVVSLSCGRNFTVFNTAARTEASYEGEEVARLWRVKPVEVPRLDLGRIPPPPLTSSCFSGERDHRKPLPPTRLAPAVDRIAQKRKKQTVEANIDAIDMETLLHPLCRVCWRCDGFNPAPLKIWRCRQCSHDRDLHGERPPEIPLSEYEAIRKLQCMYRAKRARRFMQRLKAGHYQKVYSIKHDTFFYFNHWTNRTSWELPKGLPSNVDIPMRDPDEIPIILPPLTEKDAAVVLQSYWRQRQARQLCRHKLMEMYDKHCNMETGEVYYKRKRALLPEEADSFDTLANEQDKESGNEKRVAIIWKEPALCKRLYNLGDPIEIQRRKRLARMSTDAAAKMIQRAFRTHRALNAIRRLARSRYRKIYDTVSKRHYYYNLFTYESSWTKPILFRERGNKILRRSRKQRMTNKRYREIKARREQRMALYEDPMDYAASTIQALARQYLTRQHLFERLRHRYRKLVDNSSQQSYYYDRVLGTSSWIKPLLLGHWDLTFDAMSVAPNTFTSRRKQLPELVDTRDLEDPSRLLQSTMSERARRKRKWQHLENYRKQLTPDTAATAIQSLLRSRMAQKRVQELLADAYEQIFDPVTRHFYYHNTKTGDVRWEKPALLASMFVRVRRQRQREYHIINREEAASVLQNFFQYVHARLELHRNLHNRVEKLWDTVNRECYYFDKVTGESSWKKPILLKKHDLELKRPERREKT